MLDNCSFLLWKMFSILFFIPQLCVIFWIGFLVVIPLSDTLSYAIQLVLLAYACNLKNKFPPMALTSFVCSFKLTPVSFSMKGCNVSVTYESRILHVRNAA